MYFDLLRYDTNRKDRFINKTILCYVTGRQHLRDPESNLVRGFKIREWRIHHLRK